MATADDPPIVGRASGEALRRWRACRARGDAAGAAQAWDDVVTQEFDRLDGMVRAAGRRGSRLSAAEIEDAVSLAAKKFVVELPESFEGTSMGELVNTLKACAEFACLDVQRTEARRSAKRVPLEDVGEDGELRPSQAVLDRRLRDAADAEADEAEAEADEEREAFLAWAVPRIPDERQRLVWQRTLERVPAAEIAEELGVTKDNLYQLRSRGLRALRKLKEQWDG